MRRSARYSLQSWLMLQNSAFFFFVKHHLAVPVWSLAFLQQWSFYSISSNMGLNDSFPCVAKVDSLDLQQYNSTSSVAIHSCSSTYFFVRGRRTALDDLLRTSEQLNEYAGKLQAHSKSSRESYTAATVALGCAGVNENNRGGRGAVKRSQPANALP